MFSEFIHTAVDSVNQGILLIGARQATRKPDFKFQSGFGTSKNQFACTPIVDNLHYIHLLSHSLRTNNNNSNDNTLY